MKVLYIFRITFIPFLILLTVCNNKGQDHSITGKEITLRLEPKPGNPRNSEGDFIQLKDGRILFIYTHFTGGSGDNARAFLAGRFSKNGGKTWTTQDVLILPNEGGMNIMSVSLMRLANGKIALFYLRKNSEIDCIPFMRISTDEAKTWGEAKRCIDVPGYYVMNNDRVIQVKNGRIILPVSLHNTPESDNWFNGRIMCYYSDDEGKTFVKSQEAANPGNVTSQEPGVIELNSGQLMLFCRTDAGVQYFSFSENQGETWSPLKPGNIKSPLSPASIERIPRTGDLLLVWNNSYTPIRDGGKRTPFNLAISKDEGKTWQKIKTVESDPNGWYCYTAIEFVDDFVLLGHCAGNRTKHGGLETTQITRLNVDWIYLDATQNPFVKMDSAGTVELACKEKNAQIFYSLDGSLPTPTPGLLYKKPFSVSRTKPLLMQAFETGKPPSRIVSAYIGSDVYQKAQHISIDSGPGLVYYYYEGEVFQSDEIEKIPFVESGVVPQFIYEKRQRDRNFGLIFEGYIKIPKDGRYTFYLESNDGSVLYLDDHKFIDNDGPHGTYEKSASTALRAGKHKIELRYFQMGGSHTLKVSWQGPEFEKIEIPASVLFHVKN
ncbi:exo-alpha-sialidase [candidate division KSB1 bacterium]|nr:exo-alpha-sialidase [candidate division KSB1 bacterium]MBL7093790.1 exo-alpha-sialidase [candidate division KSB1 bacterium]